MRARLSNSGTLIAALLAVLVGLLAADSARAGHCHPDGEPATVAGWYQVSFGVDHVEDPEVMGDRCAEDHGGTATRGTGLKVTDYAPDIEKARLIYSVPMPAAPEGGLRYEHTFAFAEAHVSRCNPGDIEGGGDDDATSPCKGMHEYSYAPRIKFVLQLSEYPAVDAQPTAELASEDIRCWKARHHCPVAFSGSLAWGYFSSGYYLNLIAMAYRKDKDAHSEDRVEVEGPVKAGVAVLRYGSEYDASQVLEQSNSDELKTRVPITSSDNEDKKPRIIYRAQVNDLNPGDVVTADAMVKSTKPPDYPKNPLIGTRVFLTDDARAKKFDRGTVDRQISPSNGFNCQAAPGTEPCKNHRLGAVEVPVGAPSTMWVNVVAYAIRNQAPGPEQRIKDGGWLRVQHWTNP